MWILIIMYVWRSLGYNMILFLAGLSSIPKIYYEAFYVEGGSKIQSFRKITFVYLLPSTFVVLIISIVNLFKWYRDIYSLTGNYPNQSLYLLQHYLTNQFISLSYSKVVVTSYILAIVFGIITYIFLKIQRGVDYSDK